MKLEIRLSKSSLWLLQFLLKSQVLFWWPASHVACCCWLAAFSCFTWFCIFIVLTLITQGISFMFLYTWYSGSLLYLGGYFLKLLLSFLEVLLAFIQEVIPSSIKFMVKSIHFLVGIFGLIYNCSLNSLSIVSSKLLWLGTIALEWLISGGDILFKFFIFILLHNSPCSFVVLLLV